MYFFLACGYKSSLLTLLLVAILLVQVSTSWSSALICLLTTSLVQVVDFYSTSIASQKLDVHRIAHLSSLVAFLSAFLLASALWYFSVPMAHRLSAGVVIGAVFFILATPTLTRPLPRSSQNTLIGYSAAGLPLYQSQMSAPSLLDYVRPSMQKIMENPDSRRIFYFLLLNLVSLNDMKYQNFTELYSHTVYSVCVRCVHICVHWHLK